jgi:hypothetical protein
MANAFRTDTTVPFYVSPPLVPVALNYSFGNEIIAASSLVCSTTLPLGS